MRTLLLRGMLAAGCAIALLGGAACDRKSNTPPTPSTQTGTPKGSAGTFGKEGMEVREHGASGASAPTR